ncbi:lysosome-associated membrane glycoprotein 2 isoform X3 [Bufo bufo]|uniref:lysosome-associated membrane glycoprotein 2 isoform X3 n=1 Tax=Bufo bufo TaxID=8384 RepID=UPI001ABE17F1|nr:lysosome-associated membrane glycoprotein 2 isoform X3 [Bufo bufo]
MERYLRGVLMCLLGLGLMTEAFEVEIKDGSNACIYASMNVNFTIQYETNSNKSSNATLVVPDKVTTDGSTCGGKEVAPLLVVNFESNHSLRLNFTSDGTVYRVDMIVFTYNTNDSLHFQDAKTKGLFSTFKSVDIAIPVNATYVCLNEAVVVTENVVQVYQNVSLLAFSQDKPFTKEFHCSADDSTTQAPVTPNVTTPNTPSTTPTPTTKPMDKPTIGNYTVLNGTETCLLASMGLQLNATLLVDGKTVWTPLNIDPKNTTSSGSCGNDSALLRLNDSGTTIVEFLFLVKNKNFYLQEVNVTLVNTSGMSVRTNSNLSLWEASLGSSYLCHKEQTITVSDDLYVNTFDVRVQPFGVKNATYATAEDCISDQNFTVPIVVGAALGALIVLVMVAYFIGRKNRRSAGYQNF